MVLGEPSDGISIYARALVDHGRSASRRHAVRHIRDLDRGPGPDLWGDHVDAVHAHVSDRLVAESGDAWNDLVERCRLADLPLVVTLHDLPQTTEDAERNRRRSAVYRDIAGDADLVVVSSESERIAARRIGIDASVVDHPIFPARRATVAGRPDAARGRQARTIVVAGFVHPGKGVVEMVDAIGDVGGTALDGWQLRLVGAVAERHRDEPAKIEHRARRNGLDFHHVGGVSELDWARELRRATVGVCPHLHCSASGSLLDWIAHGRRPVVTALPFSRELADERPDALTLVERPADWREAIETAASDDSALHDHASWRTPAAAADRLDDIVGRFLDSEAGPRQRRTA